MFQSEKVDILFQNYVFYQRLKKKSEFLVLNYFHKKEKKRKDMGYFFRLKISQWKIIQFVRKIIRHFIADIIHC